MEQSKVMKNIKITLLWYKVPLNENILAIEEVFLLYYYLFKQYIIIS
jgi:hypothetical protein